MTPPLTHDREWEKEYRIELAKILGRSGKFAMNNMVELMQKTLSSQRAALVAKIEQEVDSLIRGEVMTYKGEKFVKSGTKENQIYNTALSDVRHKLAAIAEVKEEHV